MTQTTSANGWHAIDLPEDNLAKEYTFVTVGEGDEAKTFIKTIRCTYWGKSIADPYVQQNGVVYLKTFENNGQQIINAPQWIPQA